MPVPSIWSWNCAAATSPALDVASALDVSRGADVVVLLTEWTEFREIAPEAMAEAVNERRIFDGRHALDSTAWRAAGWEYKALGRP